ncbi:MAG: response regulator receiver protein [Burkholderiales bacterium]|jgi:pilus assembly protein CpaE|nr:MAG: response regulator receiver protein [Burkholderiales bacterium]
MSLKLTLFASSPEALAELSLKLPHADDSTAVSSALGSVSALALEIERGRPDLVVAQTAPLGDSELRQVESALIASPATSMILLSPERSPEYLIRVMRAGVREVVPTPLTNGELTAAYGRQIERVLAQRGGGRVGRVLAFLPAKGGSGSTFLSTNLAYALAARGQRVALVDLNLHFGDAALFLSEAKPAQTIADLAREASRLDPTFVESSMMPVAPNLTVLASPDTPEGAMDVTPEAVERIVSILRGRFDFVLLDMGRIIDAAGVRALDQAEAVYITLQLTLPFIHDAKRLLTLLEKLGYARDKLHVVVNRWEKGGEITSADVHRSLGVTVDLEIPNSFAAVAHAINHGIPILKSAPKDAVSKALRKLADRLAPAGAEERRGWFGLSIR